MKQKKSQSGGDTKKARETKYQYEGERREKTQKLVLEALEKSFGNISIACERAGISRRAFYKWLDQYPDFAERVHDVNERTLDYVESKLLKGIENGSSRLIIFYLSTKGRSRGYGTAKESEDKSAGITLHITSEEAEY